jgi:hypothetical protein
MSWACGRWGRNERGGEVYLDENSLKAGEQYHTKLSDLILSSDYFVFLISQHSVAEGSYCLTELKFAEQKWAKEEKGFVPVMLEDTDEQILPALLRQSNYLRPRGNITAEVTSEILSQEQGVVTDEIEKIRDSRVAFAQRYFQADLRDKVIWLRRKAIKEKKQQKLYSMGIVISAVGIMLSASWAMSGYNSSNLTRQYLLLSIILLASYPLLYVLVISYDPWRWGIYTLQADKMEAEYRRYVSMISPYNLGLGELRSRELFIENVEELMNG